MACDGNRRPLTLSSEPSAGLLGLGFRVQGLEDLGSRVWGVGFRV